MSKLFNKRRLISFILTLAMILSFVPLSTFAQGESNVIDTSPLRPHPSNGLQFNSGIYFAMEENAAPFSSDWSKRYEPTDTSCIRLIRNGTTTNVAILGRNPLVKYTDTEYYLDTIAWTMGDVVPIVPGDILVVQGRFQETGVTNGAIVNIPRTYIRVNWDGTLTFSENQPETDVKPFPDTQPYTIGTWVGDYHNFSLKNFYELRMAGINQIIGVVPHWLGNTAEVRNNAMNNLLDVAELYGISVIPSLDVIFDDDGNMWDGQTIPAYNTQHPAIAGFLVWDEPSNNDLSTIAAWKRTFDSNEKFTGKEFFVNLFPEGAGQIGAGVSYDTYVHNFEEIGASIISTDIYPVNESGKVRKNYFHNMGMLASTGSEFHYTYLTAKHKSGATQYGEQDENLLRWQMDVGLTFGAKALNQYYYASRSETVSSILDIYGNIKNQTLYNNVAKVDNDHLKWLGEYNEYTWKSAGYVKTGSNVMLDNFYSGPVDKEQFGISKITSTGNILYGMFQKGVNEFAYMITNAGIAEGSLFDVTAWSKNFSMTDVTVSLTLSGNYSKLKVISKGATSYLNPAAADGTTTTFTVPVGAYEGVFVVPVYTDGTYYSDISCFRQEGNYTYPTRKGFVFSGWYQDAAFTTPISTYTTSGPAYAKFVDENVLKVKWQIKEGTNASSATTDLRLITTVDSPNYRNVGFRISCDGMEFESDGYKAETTYTQIAGYVEGVRQNYEPTVFSDASISFKVFRINNIPSSAFESSWYVTPFWTTLDGTTVTGIVHDPFSISMDGNYG